MKYRTLATLSLAGLLLAGCASTAEKSKSTQVPVPPPSAATGPELELGEVMTIKAVVQAVDLDNRTLTLKGDRGRVASLNMGEEASNLDQIKTGDRVVVKYREAVATQLSKATVGSAATAQKLSATLRDKVIVAANVASINPKTRKLVLQSQSEAVTVKAPQDMDLKGIKVGEQVQATYVEPFGIAVEPASQKGAKKK